MQFLSNIRYILEICQQPNYDCSQIMNIKQVKCHNDTCLLISEIPGAIAPGAVASQWYKCIFIAVDYTVEERRGGRWMLFSKPPFEGTVDSKWITANQPRFADRNEACEALVMPSRTCTRMTVTFEVVVVVGWGWCQEGGGAGSGATSVSPKAQSANGCNERRGKRSRAHEKTQRRRRRDRPKDTNTDG